MKIIRVFSILSIYHYPNGPFNLFFYPLALPTKSNHFYLNLSFPAVSQILNLTVWPSTLMSWYLTSTVCSPTSIVRTLKLTPMVFEVRKANRWSENCVIREVFPAPESPNKTNFNTFTSFVTNIFQNKHEKTILEWLWTSKSEGKHFCKMKPTEFEFEFESEFEFEQMIMSQPTKPSRHYKKLPVSS